MQLVGTHEALRQDLEATGQYWKPVWQVLEERASCRDHHALLVRLALEHLEQLEGTIAALDRRVEEVMAPFAGARDRLDTITGVGKRAAETIVAEIGTDMTVFPHRRSSGLPGLGAARATTAPGASAAPASPPRATAGWVRC